MTGLRYARTFRDAGACGRDRFETGDATGCLRAISTRDGYSDWDTERSWRMLKPAAFSSSGMLRSTCLPQNAGAILPQTRYNLLNPGRFSPMSTMASVP